MQECESNKAHIASSRTKIDSLEANIQGVDDELQELQYVLQQRHDDSDMTNSVTNPVVRIKQSLLHMQQEIREMNVSIHFLNHNLLALRQRGQKEKMKKVQAHKKKRQRRKGKGASQDDEEDNDSR